MKDISLIQDANTRDVHNETRVDWKALAISRYERMEEHRITAELLAQELKQVLIFGVDGNENLIRKALEQWEKNQ